MSGANPNAATTQIPGTVEVDNLTVNGAVSAPAASIPLSAVSGSGGASGGGALGVNARLMGWYAALANRDYARVNVAVFGDSITAGQGATTHPRGFSRLLAARFRQRLGLATGGVGYINGTDTLPSPTFTWPAALASAPGPNINYSPAATATVLSGVGQTITFTVTGDSADIMWLGLPSGGTFSWKVDAGATTNVSTVLGSATDGQITHVSLGAAGSHTVTITWVSGTCYVDGLVVYNGDFSAGILTHDCGHSGWGAFDWANDLVSGTAYWAQAVAALSPNLLLIILGANDVGSGRTVAQFQTSLSSIITFIRGTVANIPVGIVALPAQSTFASTWPSYVSAMYAAAAGDASNLSMVIDLSQRMPNVDATLTYGVWNDIVHPTDKGHSMIADNLASMLVPASLL